MSLAAADPCLRETLRRVVRIFEPGRYVHKKLVKAGQPRGLARCFCAIQITIKKSALDTRVILRLCKELACAQRKKDQAGQG